MFHALQRNGLASTGYKAETCLRRAPARFNLCLNFTHYGKNDLEKIKGLREAKQSTPCNADLREIIFDFWIFENLCLALALSSNYSKPPVVKSNSLYLQIVYGLICSRFLSNQENSNNANVNRVMHPSLYYSE